MRIKRLGNLIIGLALCLGVLLAGARALTAAAAPVGPARDLSADLAQTIPGKLVVAVAPGFDEPDLAALLARHGAHLDAWLPNLGLALVTTPVGRERYAAEALLDEPTVDFVAPHRTLASIAETPTDPHWNLQWGPAKVQAPAAWDLAWSDRNVAIAILDTGVLQDHWDLRDRTWYNPGESAINPTTGLRTCDAAIARNGLDDDDNGFVDDCRGWDFVAWDGDPRDEHGHGTVVAGIAAASTNNPSPSMVGVSEGIAGMGRQSTLMALRVLGADGSGSSFSIAAALDYAATQGATVANLSLTFDPTLSPDLPDILMLGRAVTRAQAAGVLVVGASGNQNYRNISFPARFAGVLAVGASNPQDQRARHSPAARALTGAPGWIWLRRGWASTLRCASRASTPTVTSTGQAAAPPLPLPTCRVQPR